MLEQALPILNAALLAGAYSFLGYRSRRRDGESLDASKSITTVLIGLVIGAAGAAAGDVITPETLTPDYLAAKELQYGTVIIAFEKVLELVGVLPILRGFFARKAPPAPPPA